MPGEIRRRKNKPPNSNAAPPSSHNVQKVEPPKVHHTATPNKYDEYAWFILFLSALSYFILTRSTGRNGLLSKFSQPYVVVANSVSLGDSNNVRDEELLRGIFYIQKGRTNQMTLLYPLEVIISSPPDSYSNNNNNASKVCPSPNACETPPFLSHLHSTTWVHDPDLGRGYLLIADAGRSGRIWRWEVGGGPITIGKSLFMESSGCRSGFWGECPGNLFGSLNGVWGGSVVDELPPLLGTASVVVELTRDAERSTEGANLVVAEWGERRIIRVEGETGARTPLVAMLPVSMDENSELRRVFHPNHLIYSPFGDLLFSDSYRSGNDEPMASIYRLKEAVHVPPIPVEKSREAHGWNGTSADDSQVAESVEMLFTTDGWIDGMALGDYTTLFISVVTQSTDEGELVWTKTVYKLSLVTDEDDDGTQNAAKEQGTADHEIFYSISSKECQVSTEENNFSDNPTGSKLAIDEHRTVYLVACPSSVVVLSKDDGHVVGKLTLDTNTMDSASMMQSSTITSVNFGEDGYMYVTTSERLMRIKSRVKGMHIPTNLVVPPSLKEIRRDKRDRQ